MRISDWSSDVCSSDLVDNLARFVGEGRLAIPVAASSDDPNAVLYADARARAEAFGGIDIVDLPSPGRIERDGEIAAASYMNFYIGNSVVVVPTYGVAQDRAAEIGRAHV